MRAVLLAGGRGSRLRPFTTNFPKPLMPVGDTPILEILLRQLKHHGITEIRLLTGHLAYLIEGYFGDGAGLGLQIEYLQEGEPLGTAGPLRQLAGSFSDDFLVMNGDLLTDLDFTALIARHREAGADATVGTYRRDERVDFGVLRLGETDEVIAYDEKPTLHVDVSMGAYVMTPRVLETIPEGRYDMPELIAGLLSSGHRIATYRHSGIWFDIGRIDDYERANQLLADNPQALTYADR